MLAPVGPLYVNGSRSDEQYYALLGYISMLGGVEMGQSDIDEE